MEWGFVVGRILEWSLVEWGFVVGGLLERSLVEWGFVVRGLLERSVLERRRMGVVRLELTRGRMPQNPEVARVGSVPE